MVTSMGEPAVFTRIPQLRAQNGWSQKRLAELVGVHFQTIGSLERGEYNPSLRLALTIAQTFNLRVEDVFSLSPLKTGMATKPGQFVENK